MGRWIFGFALLLLGTAAANSVEADESPVFMAGAYTVEHNPSGRDSDVGLWCQARQAFRRSARTSRSQCPGDCRRRGETRDGGSRHG